VYPENPNGMLIVQNFVTINVNGTEFQQFNAKIGDLIEALRGSNEIGGEVRAKLVAEITGGQALVKGPKPQRSLIEILLLNPLKAILVIAGSTIIGELATEALHLLLQMI
jgi:hypothetical protein